MNHYEVLISATPTKKLELCFTSYYSLACLVDCSLSPYLKQKIQKYSKYELKLSTHIPTQ